MKLLLVVCTGNICRSPMGEAFLKKKIRELGREKEYEVKSQGIIAQVGTPVSENSITAMGEIGIDISGYRSDPIDKDDVIRAEKIYVMSESHKQALELNYDIREPKIEVLNVNDPYGCNLGMYRKCRDDIMEYFNNTEL